MYFKWMVGIKQRRKPQKNEEKYVEKWKIKKICNT